MNEYHSFYFIAWLTRKRSRTNLCFVTAFRSYLPVQSGLGIQFVLAWIGLKQARSWFRFPAWVLCFGCHVFSSGSFGCSRDVTGKLSSAIVEFVAPLRLWHGLGLLWLVSLWESSGPASRSALRALERAVTSSGAPESCKREKRASARTRASF